MEIVADSPEERVQLSAEPADPLHKYLKASRWEGRLHIYIYVYCAKASGCTDTQVQSYRVCAISTSHQLKFVEFIEFHQVFADTRLDTNRSVDMADVWRDALASNFWNRPFWKQVGLQYSLTQSPTSDLWFCSFVKVAKGEASIYFWVLWTEMKPGQLSFCSLGARRNRRESRQVLFLAPPLGWSEAMPLQIRAKAKGDCGRKCLAVNSKAHETGWA